jgi:methionyl-tRNA formyltransferase
MRVIFCGTPEIAVPTLQRLLAAPQHRVIGVITQPDRPRGREMQTAESPVKIAARDAGLEIFQPEKIRSPEAQAWLEARAPDVALLIAYGQILPARLLSIPRFGWINLHASLLPKYRGAAPIAWAIARGETRTGITTMQVDPGMDTGPILLQKEMEIGSDETAPQLSARMAEAGAPLILQTLERLERGTLEPRPQDLAQASYAPMLKREDGRIQWAMTAAEIYNRMRGFAPWPGTFADFRGKRVHLWGCLADPKEVPSKAGKRAAPGAIYAESSRMFVACGANSWLELDELQSEGRKRMSAREFLSGARIGPDERFQ